MADIVDRLEALCDYADKALKEVNASTRELFLLMAQDANESKFDYTDEHQDLIDDIKYHGRIFDSASFVYHRVIDPLASGKAKVHDLDLTGKDRSLDSLNEYISDALNDNKLYEKQFVYFAWKSRPEMYYYVGKAKSGARVNLASHGKLLEALKDASHLSCIFPVMSTSEIDIVSNLEAALIHLVEFRTGDLPIHNKRKEKFEFGYECGVELSNIKNLIAKIQKQIE